MNFCNSRIQDSDGGFFERFGSILHAREETNNENIAMHPDIKNKRPKDAMPEVSDVTFASRAAVPDEEEEGKDSGNESAEADSDSEEKREANIRKLQNSLVGMNVSHWKLSKYFI